MNRNHMKKLFALLLAAAAMLTFTSVAQTCGTGKASQKIESFEIVTLRLSGMRFTTEYEIVMKGKDAEVVEYAIRYNKNEDKRVPERQTVCSADASLFPGMAFTGNTRKVLRTESCSLSRPPLTATGKSGRKARKTFRNISGN